MKKSVHFMSKLTCAIVLGVPWAGSSLAAENSTSDPWMFFHGAPKIKDVQGNYWKVRGRILWDLADISETPNGALKREINDTEFRAARIGIEGQYTNFKYKAEVDFAGSKTTYKDVKLTWKGPLAVTIGQMQAGGSLEELTSSRHIEFMERGMATDGLGFDRRLGVKVAKTWKNAGIDFGLYGNSINGAIDGNPTNTVYSARGYVTPVQTNDQIIHLGASIRHTDRERGGPKHSARWDLHLAKEKIKPKIGDDAFLIGFETAAVHGPFHAHAEYLSEDGDRGSAKGGFVQAGYFLTGETRKYKKGKFDRTKPSKPLSKGGVGAFEIGARFDMLDARKASAEKVNAYALGVTWYPESHLRVKLNYVSANGDTFDASGLQMRLQMDW